MRVLVCGGRDFDAKHLVWRALDALHSKTAISVLIHGDAPGADRSAGRWAANRGVAPMPFPADWNDISAAGAVVKKSRRGNPYNALAGHWRNQRMIDEGKPDLVVAFPGGTGTADMVKRATDADIAVLEPLRPQPEGAHAEPHHIEQDRHAAGAAADDRGETGDVGRREHDD